MENNLIASKANCKLANVPSGNAIAAQRSSRNMLHIPPSGGDGRFLNIDELMPLLAKAVDVNVPTGGNAKKALETIRNYVGIFESIDALIESLDYIEFNKNPTSFEVEQFDKLKPEKPVSTGTAISIQYKYTDKNGAASYPHKVNIPIQDSAKEVDKIINNSNSKLISVEKK